MGGGYEEDLENFPNQNRITRAGSQNPALRERMWDKKEVS
jgi:hypothetical protein